MNWQGTTTSRWQSDIECKQRRVKCAILAAIAATILALWLTGCASVPNGCAVYAAAAADKLVAQGRDARVLTMQRATGRRHAVTYWQARNGLSIYDWQKGVVFVPGLTMESAPQDIALAVNNIGLWPAVKGWIE